jgi:hypothetical protein
VRTPAINSALETSITRDRLAKYLADTGDNLDDALKLYEENTRLAEAFYTPLQALEVTLRNALHDRLTAVYGPDWYANGKPGFQPNSEQMLLDAIGELSATKSNYIPGDLVAELKFAFWVGLLGTHYDATLWRRCFYKAFTGGGGKPRSTVHGRFNALRRFRNRVMHHEPIYQRPLQQLHDEMIEAIEWICKDTAAWTAHHSRVPTVLSTTP